MNIKFYIVTKNDSELSLEIESKIKDLIKVYNFELVDELQSSDCIITVGGDGTILHTLQEAIKYDIPVFGVHAGRLGYLTACVPQDLDEAFLSFKNNGIQFTSRSIAKTSINENENFSINEVVLQRVQSHKMADFDIYINDVPFTTYFADAVMVATPTGSTAYSFSAGGPIVSPDLSALIFTPVAPHVLLDRSIILANNESISIVPHVRVNLVIDGKVVQQIECGEKIKVSVGDKQAKIVSLFNRPFHSILSEKFMLPNTNISQNINCEIED